MQHGRRYKYHIIRLEGQHCVARYPVSMPFHDTIELPRIMSVQLRFKVCPYPLTDEEKRMVLRFRQFVWYYRIIHKIRIAYANLRQK